MAQMEERRQGQSAPLSSVSSRLEILSQGLTVGAIGDSPWLGSDSDSG